MGLPPPEEDVLEQQLQQPYEAMHREETSWVDVATLNIDAVTVSGSCEAEVYSSRAVLCVCQNGLSLLPPPAGDIQHGNTGRTGG